MCRSAAKQSVLLIVHLDYTNPELDETLCTNKITTARL